MKNTLLKFKKGVLKVSGYYGKYKAVRYIGTGTLMLIGGIVGAVASKSFNWLVLSVFGLVAILVGMAVWKRSQTLAKEKFFEIGDQKRNSKV